MPFKGTDILKWAGPVASLGATSRDQHLDAHRKPAISVEASQACLHILPNRLASRFGKRSICLRQRSDAIFDGSPVFVEGFENAVAPLVLHADVAKPGRMKHALEPSRLGEDKREMKIVPMMRQIPAERIGEDAPHRR